MIRCTGRRNRHSAGLGLLELSTTLEAEKQLSTCAVIMWKSAGEGYEYMPEFHWPCATTSE